MIRIFTLLAVISSLTGCVSAAIDQYSGQYRNVFHSSATVTSIRSEAGTPTETFNINTATVPAKYETTGFTSYDVFDVSGKIHKRGDGAAQGTTGAVSFGISEIIFIPVTVVQVAVDYTEKHTLVVFYDAEGNYLEHQLFDENGVPEAVSNL